MTRSYLQLALVGFAFSLALITLVPVCNAQTSGNSTDWWEMKSPSKDHIVIYRLEALTADGLRDVVDELCGDRAYCKVGFWVRPEFAPWSDEAMVASYQRTNEGRGGYIEVKCWSGVIDTFCPTTQNDSITIRQNPKTKKYEIWY